MRDIARIRVTLNGRDGTMYRAVENGSVTRIEWDDRSTSVGTPRGLETIGTLTDDDMGTLKRANQLRVKFSAGIFPNTPGDHSHFRRLARLGLIEYETTGRDIDGKMERDVQIYKLTDAGVALVEQGTAR